MVVLFQSLWRQVVPACAPFGRRASTAKKEPAAKSEPAIEAVAMLRSPFKKVFMVVVFSTPSQSLLQQGFHITYLGDLESVGLPQIAIPSLLACIQ